MSTFDAFRLSKAWLSVAVASGNTDEFPALYRTVNLELFPNGVRLVATDAIMLLASWVPTVDDHLQPEPQPDEAPIATAVAIDPHGRAKSFFAHLLKLAIQADKDLDPIPEVDINFGVIDQDPDTNTGGFEGLEATYLIIEHPDHERLKLSTYEGLYPHWQKVLGTFNPKKTGGIALNPELILRLATAAKTHGNNLVWRFGGADKMALVEIENSDPWTYGAAMPIRLNQDLDGPAETATPASPGGDF